MIAALAGALTLAALFPANAAGDWSRAADPWENAREHIIEDSSSAAPDMRPLPESITLLEQPEEDLFFYAATTEGGGVLLGVVDASGGGVTCGSLADSTEVECGFGFAEPELHGAAWVERAPAAPNGFHHELRFFGSEAEYTAYFAALPESA
ncbi:hypothetical protein EV139_1032 [Leucobacter luti]|uniref:Uncharacterized protein n=2 Tax=Leucobacter luti TaxID=340320 RepID=A0A4Q7U0N7_9MICO|nr:hypothetical protein [Leucobacter luti]RZT66905.1 hypothetical protein EV139_1032 [Leucobacter luti]